MADGACECPAAAWAPPLKALQRVHRGSRATGTRCSHSCQAVATPVRRCLWCVTPAPAALPTWRARRTTARLATRTCARTAGIVRQRPCSVWCPLAAAAGVSSACECPAAVWAPPLKALQRVHRGSRATGTRCSHSCQAVATPVRRCLWCVTPAPAALPTWRARRTTARLATRTCARTAGIVRQRPCSVWCPLAAALRCGTGACECAVAAGGGCSACGCPAAVPVGWTIPLHFACGCPAAAAARRGPP